MTPFRCLSRLLLGALVLLSAGAVPEPARAQPSRSEAPPVRLLDLYGPRTAVVGRVLNYRTRPVDNSGPIHYLWDFGDGIASVGNPVSHVYEQAGTYRLQVVAANESGRDTLRTEVTVTVPPPEPVPVAALRPAPKRSAPAAPAPDPIRYGVTVADVRPHVQGDGPLPLRSGFTWGLGSSLDSMAVQMDVLRYRLQGYRAEVWADTTGPGSTAYRVAVGHYTTLEQARVARALLPEGGRGRQVYALSPDARMVLHVPPPDVTMNAPMEAHTKAESAETTRAETAPSHSGASESVANASAGDVPVEDGAAMPLWQWPGGWVWAIAGGALLALGVVPLYRWLSVRTAPPREGANESGADEGASGADATTPSVDDVPAEFAPTDAPVDGNATAPSAAQPLHVNVPRNRDEDDDASVDVSFFWPEDR